MEILLPVIKLMTYIGIGLIAIGLLAIRGIFRGSRSKFNYVIGAAICFALGFYFLTMKSSGSIKVTDDSLTLKAILSKTQVVRTEEIQRAWVEDLQDTEWRPISRSSGTAFGNIRTGWYRLQNGRRAFVVLEGERALFIEADNNRVYILGLEDFEPFIRKVKSNSNKLRNLLQYRG
jgi:hypothetical protein